MNRVSIIAGPCGIDGRNKSVLGEIAEIRLDGEFVVEGVRVVGLKSRSELHDDKVQMGLDYGEFLENIERLFSTGGTAGLVKHPSIDIMRSAIADYGFKVATELMEPAIQMPLFDRFVPKDKLMVWNSRIDQSGWHMMLTAKYCRKNGWHMGFKHSVHLGGDYRRLDDPSSEFSVETAWKSLAKWADIPPENKVFIQRGVDVPEKGDFLRYAPIHQIAGRVKKSTGLKMYFDPSHTYGGKLRYQIPGAIVDALAMQMEGGEYLYDGILVEVGTSFVDADQHISVAELEGALRKVAAFREFNTR